MAQHYGVAVVPARPLEAARQGQGGGRSAGGRALDRGRAAQAKVLLARRSQPGHCGACSRASMNARSASAKARAAALFEIARPARPAPLARGALPVRRLGNGPRQHRLSRRVRRPLLQRALPTHAAGGGGPRHRVHGGDLPQRRARGLPQPFPHPAPATTLDEHRPKPHQRHLRVDALTPGGMAAKIGPATAEVVERILASKPASRAGIPLLPRHHPARLTSIPTHEWRRVAPRPGARLLFLPEPESILENELEDQTPEPPPNPRPPLDHPNIRGPSYFDTVQ